MFFTYLSAHKKWSTSHEQKWETVVQYERSVCLETTSRQKSRKLAATKLGIQKQMEWQ